MSNNARICTMLPYLFGEVPKRHHFRLTNTDQPWQFSFDVYKRTEAIKDASVLRRWKRILIGKFSVSMSYSQFNTRYSFDFWCIPFLLSLQNVIVSPVDRDQLGTLFGRSRQPQNGGNVFRRRPRRGPQAEVQARCRRGERKITIYSHFLWHGPRSWITNSYLLGS